MNYREFLILFDRPGSDLWRDHGSPTIWILAANFLTDDLFDRGGFADYTESDWKDHHVRVGVLPGEVLEER